MQTTPPGLWEEENCDPWGAAPASVAATEVTLEAVTPREIRDYSPSTAPTKGPLSGPCKYPASLVKG